MGTPRRRLNIVGVVANEDEDNLETEGYYDKEPEIRPIDAVVKPKKKVRKHYGLCLGKAGLNAGKAPVGTTIKHKRKKGRISMKDVVEKQQTPRSQRLISHFMTPKRVLKNEDELDDLNDKVEQVSNA